MVYCRNCKNQIFECNYNIAKGIVDARGEPIEDPKITDVVTWWKCEKDPGDHHSDTSDHHCIFYDPFVKQFTLDCFA